jgi:hypothetical protein
MVWYNSYGVGYDGPTWLDADCRMTIEIYDIWDNLLDAQVYCVLAFDDNDEYHENIPGWIYQECRPDEYEPGAPDYCRLADSSIQPPVNWWYRLKVSPVADMELDWSQAAYMRVWLIAKGTFLDGDYVGMYWDDFCYVYGDTPCGTPTVTIHDDTTSVCGECGGNPPVQRDTTECTELIYAMNGALAGPWGTPPEGYGNVWLYPGGSVTVTSTLPSREIYIQYGCSDYNDGVTDIYVDDMVNPLVRIDTYERCDWYVEISGLCPTPHTVKVVASMNANMAGVIPSPHRAVPDLGDNNVWYFCFGYSAGPSQTAPATWGSIKSMYK